MKRSTDRILTTHAGSLPRPDELRAMILKKQQGERFDEAAFAARVKSAVENLRVSDCELNQKRVLSKERIQICTEIPPELTEAIHWGCLRKLVVSETVGKTRRLIAQIILDVDRCDSECCIQRILHRGREGDRRREFCGALPEHEAVR